ncbi:MAG: DUF1326 domain-containing protein [Halioglobus sp.]
MHEGAGSVQLIIDDRADDTQRAAIETIASGGEAAEGSSFLQVFASTMETLHPTLFKPIEFECDEKARILPTQGMEFLSADMASGTSQTRNEWGWNTGSIA